MAVPFPSDSDYNALTLNGVPFSAAVGDENPGETDIVGTTAFPAIYFVAQDGYAFFRFRLREDPAFGGGFSNFAWYDYR